MKEQEIIEGNKLIAEFMGYKYFLHPDEQNLPGWRRDVKTHPKLMYSGTIGKRVYLTRNHKDLQFESSWDWLMPVLDKIQKDYHILLHNNSLTISNADCVFLIRGDSKIQSAWLTIVAFIKWYNQNS